MHSFYLWSFYLKNLIAKGELELAGSERYPALGDAPGEYVRET
jgi:hypothetical protein